MGRTRSAERAQPTLAVPESTTRAIFFLPAMRTQASNGKEISMPRKLPPRPSLEQLRKQAKALHKAKAIADPEALARIREANARWKDMSEAQLAAAPFALADAQLVIAREFEFASWSRLQAHVRALEAAGTAAELGASLRDAAGKGDLARLRALLDAHPKLINERGGEGVRTALHHAVFGNSEPAARLLLERGADPNIRCEGDNAYPLHFAVEKHRFPLLRLLVEHGADTIGEGDYHELGVIGWATAWESIPPDPEIVSYLLAHGARHNIFSAVAMGDVAAIRALVAQSPAELERRMDMGNRRRFPLHLAVVKKQRAALSTLLDLGARIEYVDEARFTPLDQAAMAGSMDLAQILLDRGAELRLPAAIALGRTHDVARLLREDPDAFKPGGRWAQLIIRAAEFSGPDVIESLIRAGAEVNVRDDVRLAIDSTNGYTALHAAAWHGNLAAIGVLMRHGANVRAREEKYRGTPAGWADYAGRKEARDLILEGPIDIIEAIQYDRIDRVSSILDAEPASINLPFREYGLFPWDAEPWHTPLAYAVMRGRERIAQLLIERGADRSLRSPQGESLNSIAHKAGSLILAQMLDMPSD
ncbi:hypothetical protein DYQ86_19995 [Acidobacteria bacterium AB60]|nr:hypothetical protein DYQ86_19995 [Acidobacteria bacterium AB60]